MPSSSVWRARPAASELAVPAGAQRVEGCLFGNGERTGNVDLVTLALNLHTQGVDPMVDFSDIDAVREVVERCNRLPVPVRHPYAGDLVDTASSGTHQDAISKGFAEHARRAAETGVPERELPWSVPYLPIDPADIGRSYEAVIRVNSQSGKGGIAYLLEKGYGIDLPRGMRPEFSKAVQRATDDSGREASAEELWELFRTTYLAAGTDGAVRVPWWETRETAPGAHESVCDIVVAGGSPARFKGTGNGPVAAFTTALAEAGIEVEVLSYFEHSTTAGQGSPAVAYVECRIGGRVLWGAGQDTSVLTASVRAVLSAVNRARVEA
ncbi:hypothetical protein SSPIM334S_07166 [Streptomyces spiroverticillatus]